MTIYLDHEDLLLIAPDALGQQEVLVADHGLLEAAAARPRTSVFGEDAYPDVPLKAAALMHSIACNHCLIDGNKRLAWHAAYVFLTLNDHEPYATQDEAYELTMAVASGQLRDLHKIAARFRLWCTR